MIVIENCNSLSDLRQKLIDGEEVRTRQEPYKVSEYDKDHIWYKGNQYISLRRFLEVKAEAEKEPCADAVNKLPPVTPQPKIGHWIYRIYGGFHEQGNWYCSRCDYIFNGGYGHAEYCPKCGCKMSEDPTEEVMRI